MTEIGLQNPTLPIHKFPSEIIVEIIGLASTIEYTDSYVNDGLPLPCQLSLDVKRGIWVFGRVCSRWRAIISSFPILWGHIHISRTDIKMSSAPEILREALEKSKNQPLVIDMTERPAPIYTLPRPISLTNVNPAAPAIPTIPTKPETEIIPNLVKILIGESHRWKDVRFKIDDPELAALFIPLKGRLPWLERVHLYGEYFNFRATHLKDAFKIAPRLRKVALRDVQNAHAAHLPWSQLTHFASDDSCESNQIKTLRRMPNAVHFEGSSGPNGKSDDQTIIPLPHLLSFTGAVLDQISAPALENLNITSQLLLNLPRFIRRSSCSLSTLILNGDLQLTLSVGEIKSALQSVPTVTTFIMWPEHAVDDIAQFLTCTNPVDQNPVDQGFDILPNLRALQFDVCELHERSFPLIVDMIKSRRQVGRQGRDLLVFVISRGNVKETAEVYARSVRKFTEQVDLLRAGGMSIKTDLHRSMW